MVFCSHNLLKVYHSKSLLRLDEISLLETPIKSKEKIKTFQHMLEHNIYFHSKGEELSIAKKHWTTVRLRSPKANAETL